MRRATQSSRSAPSRAGSCTAHATKQCLEGDVWWLDSCGIRESKAQECHARLCRDGACERLDTGPCIDPPEGRCDGRRAVRTCIAGRSRVIDCAAQGLECALGDEGAECVLPIPPEERCAGAPRCEAGVLVACEAGRKVRTDCEAQRAQCLQLPGDTVPSCVRVEPNEVDERGCGPCGCPADPSAREQHCDGFDDDGDGLVDEELACGPVPVIAFVVSDGAGGGSHSLEDVEAEIARANTLFARTNVPAPPSLVLADVVMLEDASLLEIDPEETSRLALDPRVHPTRDEFYVPLVFTDVLAAGGGAPKAGLSTLANGTCGGMQESSGPPVGIVIVQKGRTLTTVTHEVGHFLGLCHTHGMELGQARIAVRDEQRDALVACDASCRREGDGICDTPLDPGPEQCAYDADCETLCRGGEEPAADNLMSYYSDCRSRFTDEQIRLVQHTIALRRGWHRCLDGSCTCELGDKSCPVGMACSLVSLSAGESMARCALEGPLRPGAVCESADRCGHGSVCLREPSRGLQRCVRPCTASFAGCTCSEGEGLRVCMEDLG